MSREWKTQRETSPQRLFRVSRAWARRSSEPSLPIIYPENNHMQLGPIDRLTTGVGFSNLDSLKGALKRTFYLDADQLGLDTYLNFPGTYKGILDYSIANQPAIPIDVTIEKHNVEQKTNYLLSAFPTRPVDPSFSIETLLAHHGGKSARRLTQIVTASVIYRPATDAFSLNVKGFEQRVKRGLGWTTQDLLMNGHEIFDDLLRRKAENISAFPPIHLGIKEGFSIGIYERQGLEPNRGWYRHEDILTKLTFNRTDSPIALLFTISPPDVWNHPGNIVFTTPKQEKRMNIIATDIQSSLFSR